MRIAKVNSPPRGLVATSIAATRGYGLRSVLRGTVSRRRDRRGAAAVEFSIVATIFFVVLLSVFEFGWITVIRHTADNAAYEATRVAIVPGATAQDARDEAARILGIVGTQGARITVRPNTIDEDTEQVEVQIEIPTAANGIIGARLLRNFTMRSSSKLLTERPRL
jgi:Flp pilus assembly protein TadG